MTTRAQLRDRIRVELGDTTAGAYVWSDGQLNDWLAEALNDWSLARSPELRQTVTTESGTLEYRLDKPVITAAALLLNGKELEKTRWYILNSGSGSSLFFIDNPGEGSATLVFYGYYTLPVQDASVLDVAGPDEAALLYFVCWHANNWLDAQREKGNRATSRTDTRGYQQLYQQQKQTRGRKARVSTLSTGSIGGF